VESGRTGRERDDNQASKESEEASQWVKGTKARQRWAKRYLRHLSFIQSSFCSNASIMLSFTSVSCLLLFPSDRIINNFFFCNS
jgi:hypothetical protein